MVMNLVFNIVFFATMLQFGMTAVVMWFMEDRVIEFSTKPPDGMEAFGRFLDAFGDAGPSFRKQMALLHYMNAFYSVLVVFGMFVLGNFRMGHLFAAVGSVGFAYVSTIVAETVGSYPQMVGNEAIVKQAPQGIMVFYCFAAANFVAFLLSKKSLFPTAEDCERRGKND